MIEGVGEGGGEVEVARRGRAGKRRAGKDGGERGRAHG